MWTSFRSAASGMIAQQRALDTAADNLSKMQVHGAKARRVSFLELAPELRYLGVPDGEGNVLIDARETGTGVKPGVALQDLSQGEFQHTDNPLDVAIDGDGFLEITVPGGRIAYTRTGTLQVDGLGRLVTATGAMVSPQIEVPPDTDALQVSPDGSVIATSTDGAQRSIGRLKLVQFANPEGLQPIAGNILLATVASGAPIEGTPGESGMGTVVAGALEMSNIDTREEYLRIVQAQRAYELNVRALKTMDEMLGDAQNLRRQ